VRSETDPQPDSRYSWVVAGVGTIAMFFTFGTPMSYGIFRAPTSETFGIPPVTLSIVFSFMLFSFYIGSGSIGVFGSQISSRVVLLACALVTAVVAPSMYFTGSFVGLLLVFALLGIALGTAYVIIASVIPRWFDERRGAATGLIFVGNGLGLFVLPPLWQTAIARLGLRQSFLVLLAITACAFFLAGLVCKRPPWSENPSSSAVDVLEWLTDVGRTRTFQLVFAGIALSFAWYPLLAAYAVDLFSFRGLSPATASTAFGFIGGVSIISRIGAGYLADRAGSRRAYLLALLSVAVGLAFLFLPPVYLLPVALFLIGLGLGGTATLYIPLLMTIYPPEKNTAIVGIGNIAIGIATLAMPPIGIASVAYTGGYFTAIAITFIATVLGILTITLGTK
jgi:OFA family oxalate/formate antiporter-like MFS transporter